MILSWRQSVPSVVVVVVVVVVDAVVILSWRQSVPSQINMNYVASHQHVDMLNMNYVA